MATRKVKHARMMAKREAFLNETRREGIMFLAKERERRLKKAQKAFDDHKEKQHPEGGDKYAPCCQNQHQTLNELRRELADVSAMA